MLTPENISKYTNDSFDNVPTYKELLEQLKLLTDEQLACPLTVELDLSEECIPGFLDITGINHDSLADNIPVIRICW